MTNLEIILKVREIAKANGYDPQYDFSGIYEEFFNHEFAKAFWGVDQVFGYPNPDDDIPAWEWHLQQMVLEPEPLKYLEKFLDKEEK
jgi:hypothetical protein